MLLTIKTQNTQTVFYITYHDTAHVKSSLFSRYFRFSHFFFFFLLFSCCLCLFLMFFFLSLTKHLTLYISTGPERMKHWLWITTQGRIKVFLRVKLQVIKDL